MSLVAIVLLLSACNKQTVSALSVTTSVDDNVENVVELVIEAEDEDGIETIQVDIADLNVHLNYTNVNETKWEATESLTIDSNVATNNAEIIITVTDKTGEITTKTSTLTL